MNGMFEKFHVLLAVTLLLTLTLSALLPVYSGPMDKDRSGIDIKYKWNLNDIFPSLDAWEKEKTNLSKSYDKISAFKGRLAESGAVLKEALDTYYQNEKEFVNLYIYANMLSDQDTRQSEPMRMKQEASQMLTDLNKAASYIDPEILEIPADKMASFFKSEPGLETYRQRIDDIQRRRAHTLNAAQESLIAEAGRMAGTASEVYSILSK